MESQKLKIVYLATELGVGGGEGIAKTLIDQWRHDGHEVEVVLSYTAGRTATALAESGVKVHALGLMRGPGLILGIGKLLGAVNHIKPDVVILNNQTVLLGLAWMLRFVGPRVFLALHSNDTNEPNLTRLLYKIFVPLYTKMIVLSEIHAGYARNYLKLGNNDLRIVQNGVAPAEQGGVVPLPSALPANAFWAVSLGRLDPVKDLPTMFRAVARVVGQHPEFHVLIAGDGPIRSDLENEAERLGLKNHLHFLGAVYEPNKSALLSKAKIGFQSSTNAENFPLSILEYMRAGLPVISTRVGSVPVIVEEGKTGLLVPVADDEAFARAIIQLIENQTTREQMAKASFARQQQLFTAKAMGDGYLEVFMQPNSPSRQPNEQF